MTDIITADQMPKRKSRRTRYYDLLAQLNVGDGFKVPKAEYYNALMACRYACNFKKEFAGWGVASMRNPDDENEYIITRSY